MMVLVAKMRVSALLAVLGLSVQHVAAAVVGGPALTCKTISDIISSASNVVYPIQELSFSDNINHWFLSSKQTPECVLEVGSPDDLSAAMKIIGGSRTPFALMSGGHSSNPGFSSTTGVHISFKKMDQVVFSKDNSTVQIGAGRIWTSVYDTLEGTGYNVVGGRTPGPGIGGFTLGGGFSWKTNQFGLTCDTIKQYNMVLPNGTFTTVTPAQKDIFFALKGGLNRFGAVTSIEYYTHKQSPKVWGGLAIYGSNEVDAVLKATAEFTINNKDPKAQMITTLEGSELGTTALVLFFYDGPTRPAAYDDFKSIPALTDATMSQSFSSFVKSFPSQLVTNPRGTFATLSTSRLTPKFQAAIKQDVEAFSKVMALHSGTTVSYDIEPFTDYGKHATDSAYPHADSPLPLNLYFAWLSPQDDDFWYATMRDSVNRLRKVAIEEGIYDPDFTQYPNYSITNTTAEELYGSVNAGRLRAIRQEIDPMRVMDLAGGFDL